jgi:hypothetical protein
MSHPEQRSRAIYTCQDCRDISHPCAGRDNLGATLRWAPMFSLRFATTIALLFSLGCQTEPEMDTGEEDTGEAVYSSETGEDEPVPDVAPDLSGPPEWCLVEVATNLVPSGVLVAALSTGCADACNSSVSALLPELGLCGETVATPIYCGEDRYPGTIACVKDDANAALGEGRIWMGNPEFCETPEGDDPWEHCCGTPGAGRIDACLIDPANRLPEE